MKVVLDTNILLISIPRQSKYRPIFNAYLDSKISLVVTTAIFLEYTEILQQKSAKYIAGFIQESLLAANNIVVPEVFYLWRLITTDPDDNKFTDAYISAGADYLVTNDSHFNEIRKVEFPPVNIISADDFLEVLEKL